MTTVQVKGKHMIAALVCLIIFICVAYAVTPGFIYSRAQAMEAAGDYEKANSYYETLYTYFPRSRDTERALYFTAHHDIHDYFYGQKTDYIYIFPQSRGMSGTPGREININEAIKKLKLVRERFPESPFARHALGELGKAYYVLGDYDTSSGYLKESIKESEMQDTESTILLGKIYLQSNEYQNALELANRSLQEKPGMSPLELMELKGQAMAALGMRQEAERIFEALPEKAAQVYNEHLKDEGSDTIRFNIEHWEQITKGHLRKLDAVKKESGQKGSIAGRVLVNNEGLPGTEVYLIDKAVNEDYYTGSTENLEQVITGPDGEFVFKGLIPGNYALAVGLPLQRVEGYTMQQPEDNIKLEAGQDIRENLQFVPTVKLDSPVGATINESQITFKWDPVKGAESYRLFLGPVTKDDSGKITGTYTSTLQSDIKNNYLTLNLEDEMENNRFTGISYSSGKVNPQSILGFLHRGGEYTWGVNAYDAEGNLLTESAGYGYYSDKNELPIFKISYGELSKGDQLLLQRKYEAAISAYEEQLSKDPGDAHSLLVLARLNQYGIEHETSDPKAASRYYERLLAVKDVPSVRKALADVYYESGQFDMAYDMYSSLPETAEENWRAHYQMARIKFIRGEPGEALELLQEVVEMENGIYARTFPVALSLLLDDSQRAIKFAAAVDGGEKYIDLLRQYHSEGYNLSPGVKEMIQSGDYTAAKDLLGTKQHDLFVKWLIVKCTSHSYPNEELEKIKAQIKPGLILDLLEAISR